jgi:diguanylate cyclase (GGDEF)-like protein
MRDPNDTRDIPPRPGSPLWIYLTAVTAAGLGMLAAGLAGLIAGGIAELTSQPLFWAIGALALIGELKPIVTPGKTDPDSGVASVTFCFAGLLYWGFPAAVLLRTLSSVIVAATGRRPAFRAAFNIAQELLSLGAAWLVLTAVGVRASPVKPFVPGNGDLLGVAAAAAAFFITNFLLVSYAVAVHSRSPVLATFRKALPYQAFVNLVLLAAAPLVVVVMNRSVLLVLLFLLPLTAIYANAAMSLQREHQASHDELTGLPNRTLLLRRTGEALAEAARTGVPAGFLLLDLDRFKEVNDTLGHAVGDGLLRLVAHRLTHSVRPGDMVARLGGDEFAVLLPTVRDVAAAREVAARLRAALAEPVRLEGMSFQVEASIGIALYPADATAVEVLLQRADVAMYLAKERHTGVETYVSDSDRNSPARLALLGDLRWAIDRGELELHYQPQVTLADGLTSGMEALVRWRHPQRGMLLPGEFLPAAEQSYLMRDLTAWVIETACNQASRWRREGLQVRVTVNLSARDLLDVRLADTVAQALRRYGLRPEALALEISERVLTGEPAHAIATVEALARLGTPLCLDDFGTGYSPLVRLRRLPVAEVKVDASFIRRLPGSPDDDLIVRSLVELVRALGIRSVAEGVENAQTAAALRRMGCDGAQGWYFSGSLPSAQATQWLAGHLAPAAPPTRAPAPGPRA